jgi:hypothetical protein
MEFFEEYNCPINYHSGKVNVAENSLSHKVKRAKLKVQEIQSMQEMLEQKVKVQEENFV